MRGRAAMLAAGTVQAGVSGLPDLARGVAEGQDVDEILGRYGRRVGVGALNVLMPGPGGIIRPGVPTRYGSATFGLQGLRGTLPTLALPGLIQAGRNGIDDLRAPFRGPLTLTDPTDAEAFLNNWHNLNVRTPRQWDQIRYPGPR